MKESNFLTQCPTCDNGNENHFESLSYYKGIKAAALGKKKKSPNSSTTVVQNVTIALENTVLMPHFTKSSFPF